LAKAPAPERDEAGFVRRVIIALALTALAVAIWQLRELLMLVFGAIVIATVFHALADPIGRRLRVPGWAALGIAIVLIMTAIGAAFAAFGPEIGTQVRGLARNLPAAWQSLDDRFGSLGMGRLSDAFPAEQHLARVTNLAVSLGGGLITALLVIAGAIYLAAQPGLYRAGLVMLVPRRDRALVDEALCDSGRALAMWLRGQLITMAVVGTLTGLGLWLIGVPSALTLGLLAGLLDFVPFVGPIAAAIPALLIAFNIGGEMALWTLALYVIVQQLEGNFLYPMVQRFEVGIPPAVMLFALIAAGVLFGWPGVVFGAPLAVVTYVLVKRLYVREALHTPTDVPGEKKRRS
jgi:predicted PurR-regulated permease PerM